MSRLRQIKSRSDDVRDYFRSGRCDGALYHGSHLPDLALVWISALTSKHLDAFPLKSSGAQTLQAHWKL